MIDPTQAEMVLYIDDKGLTVEGARSLEETPHEFASSLARHWDGTYPRPRVLRIKLEIPPLETAEVQAYTTVVEIQEYPMSPPAENNTFVNTAMPDDPFAWKEKYAALQYGDMKDLKYSDRLRRAQLLVDLPVLIEASRLDEGTIYGMLGTRKPIDELPTSDLEGMADALRYPDLKHLPEADEAVLIDSFDTTSLDALRASWVDCWNHIMPDLHPRSRRLLWEAKERFKAELIANPPPPPKLAPDDLYRPSNGTEGMWFSAKFCERCIHWTEPDNKEADHCEVILLSMAFETHEPDYPQEMRYINGHPTCTKYRSKE